jgi:predicted membrane channel-forming protein YqfA (hemolysin III family)
MFEIVAALVVSYFAIGITLGLLVLLFNPSGEKASDRVLLAFFLLVGWGLLWFEDDIF